jgi:hypothetical protein
MPSKAMYYLESALILIAVVSLWPLITGTDSFLYRVWLVIILGLMVWVAQRRLARIRAASDEAKRMRDEMEKTRRPPKL